MGQIAEIQPVTRGEVSHRIRRRLCCGVDINDIDIIAITAGQPILSSPANQRIITRIAGQAVIPGPAFQPVIAIVE